MFYNVIRREDSFTKPLLSPWSVGGGALTSSPYCKYWLRRCHRPLLKVRKSEKVKGDYRFSEFQGW